jgi:Flp pilus assembly secretin CpaC
LSALLAQAGLQQYASLLQNPIATFGNGSSMGGVGVPPVTVNFSSSNSRVVQLDSVTMRASQGNEATFRFGTRYPIVNAQFSTLAPTFAANLSGAAGASSGANPLATFPSFTYEDLGMTLKAKPSIHGNSEVTLDLSMELRALGSEAFNGVPIISNRSYKGVITVKNEESAVIAGTLSRSEQDSLSGIPGLGSLPILGSLTNNRSRELDQDELLVLVTPHIVSAGPTAHGPAIPVPHTLN